MNRENERGKEEMKRTEWHITRRIECMKISLVPTWGECVGN